MSDYKIRVEVSSDYSLAVEAAKINDNLDDLKLKVSSVKKENGKNIITFSDGSQAIINDGATPTINDDGYWLINGQSTGVKAHAVHSFNELTAEEKLSIKGDKGNPLTWNDLTNSQKEALRGERGFTGPGARVTNTSYDSYGNTVLTFNDGTKATIKKGAKGDKGNTGNSVSVSSVTKSGLTNIVKFTDGKSLQVKDGKSVTVSSSRFLTSGDTEVSFSDGSRAVIKKGVDGTVEFDKLTDEQRKSLMVPVVDDLTSGGSDKALSAEQGKEINTALADLANKVAAIKPGYGVGDFIQLGNLKAVVEDSSIPQKTWEKQVGSSSISKLSAGNNDHIYMIDSNKIYKLTSDGTLDLETAIGSTQEIKAINNVIYVGEYKKIKVFNTQLNVIKTISTLGWTYNYIVDKMGNFYYHDFSGNNIVKLNGETYEKLDGFKNYSSSFHIDDQGYIYNFNSTTLYKNNTEKEQVWGVTFFDEGNDRITSMSVDALGNIYCATSKGRVVKISSHGEILWEQELMPGNNRLITNSYNDVYVTNETKLYKIGATGKVIWAFDSGKDVQCVDVDALGFIYIGVVDGSVIKLKEEKNIEIVGYEVIK